MGDLPSLDEIENAEMAFDDLSEAELTAALLRTDLDRTTRRALLALTTARRSGRGGYGARDMYRRA
jgi:hypothetical protein